METSFKAKAAWVILSILVSGACIYAMVEPLHQETTTRMKHQLEHGKPGPLDEAMKISLGLEDFSDNARRKRWRSMKQH